MKQLTVISGKGGTGKTSITAAFAALAHNHVIADCDVDAADLHLILDPVIRKEEPFFGGRLPVLDRDICDECGICADQCRFDAIHAFTIDPIACEGCGVCAHVCPRKAIIMEETQNGHWFRSDTRFGPLIHARLGIAAENSGKLVTLVREQARLASETDKKDLIIIDGPPGIGCPVIAAIAGVDLVLVVTEPTLSGIHDLERVLGVARHFAVPALVCINKADINPDNTATIRTYCKRNHLGIAGEIPFDPAVTKAMVAGQSIIEYNDSFVSEGVKQMWNRIMASLQDKSPDNPSVKIP
ncbi:MAG: ATP-binding protein [Deltaproteobacteria bacterium]|nr:ATP-binding protein [Deltaproteobacteria bacterium]